MFVVDFETNTSRPSIGRVILEYVLIRGSMLVVDVRGTCSSNASIGGTYRLGFVLIRSSMFAVDVCESHTSTTSIGERVRTYRPWMRPNHPPMLVVDDRDTCSSNTSIGD